MIIADPLLKGIMDEKSNSDCCGGLIPGCDYNRKKAIVIYDRGKVHMRKWQNKVVWNI
jgi:hypothetical protein